MASATIITTTVFFRFRFFPKEFFNQKKNSQGDGYKNQYILNDYIHNELSNYFLDRNTSAFPEIILKVDTRLRQQYKRTHSLQTIARWAISSY